MNERIFYDRIKLNFQEKEAESDYQIRKDKILSLCIKHVILFSLVSSLAVAIFQIFYFDKAKSLILYKFNLISSFSASLMYTIFILLSFFIKNLRVYKWFHYIVFFYQIFVIISFRFTIIRIVEAPSILLFLEYLFEILVRLTWVVFNLQSFSESFILNTLSLIAVWIVIPNLYPEIYLKDELYFTMAYSFVLVSVVIIAYILEKQQRIAFYYQWKADRKAQWLTNVLENLNSGFMSIKDGKVTYINSFLKNLFGKLVKSEARFQKFINPSCDESCLKINNTEQPILKSLTIDINNINSSDECAEIIFFLLENLKVECIRKNKFFLLKLIIDSYKIKSAILKLQEEMKNIKGDKERFFYDLLIKNISTILEIEKFNLLGDILLTIDGTELSFEVYCRYLYSENERVIEILMNDVSRTKLIEKHNAEFKYKTLFLSKVAHEFKNPLICIAELINQSYDSLPKELKEELEISKNFTQVKSLSNFLHILIKDLNYFSESQIGKIIQFEKNETDMKELILFTKHIATTLIQKASKIGKVEFTVNIDHLVPQKIITDEWKLKQVLVNLISNSIKFTMFGNIFFEIRLETIDDTNYIKFEVKDTGVGIKNKNFENLFKPFQKDLSNLNNQLGSGLGLSICKEITSKIGLSLEFSSVEGVGSSFWFHIPVLVKTPNSYSKIKSLNSENVFPKISITNVEDEAINIQEINLKFVTESNKSRTSSFDGSEMTMTKLYSEMMMKPKNSESHLSISDSRSIQRSESNKTEDKSASVKSKFSKFRKGPESKQSLNSIETKYLGPNREQLLKINNANEHYNYKYTVGDFIRNEVSSLRTTLTPNLQIHNPTMNNCNFYLNDFKLENMNKMNIICNPITTLANSKFINVIVADDEILNRQATVRTIYSISKELNIKINIIEAEDGVETIYLVYKAATQGVKISLIFSDENMNFMTGSQSSQIVLDITTKKCIGDIPFYLLTAYDNAYVNRLNLYGVMKILDKPISKNKMTDIIKCISV